MRQLMDRLAIFLATGFGSGLSPKAPGTMGSVAAIPLIWATKTLVNDNWLDQTGVLVCIYLVGMWSTHRTEMIWRTHDDGRIVIDEIAGMFTTLIWFPFELTTVMAGFALFRLFDIWKPGLIGTIDEKWPGAWGTFFDDVLAGIVSGVLIGIYYYFN